MDSYAFMCLGLCLTVFLIFGYLVYSRFTEQNTKMEAMVELIKSVVQDVQMIKISHTADKISSDLELLRDRTPSTTLETCPLIEHESSKLFKQIVVSDADTNSESSDEDDDSDYDDHHVIDYDDGDEVEFVPLSDTIKSEEIMSTHDTSEKITPFEDDTIRTIIFPNDDNTEPPYKVTTDIHILRSDILSSEEVQSSSSDIDLSNESSKEIQHIDIDIDETKIDFNKLDVVQLRKLVSDKKHGINPSKLKKKELIQILTTKE